MSQPIISFRYSADSGYAENVIIYLDDMTEAQQNDDSGELWGTAVVDWSAGTNIHVDMGVYSPAEVVDMIHDVDGVVEDWLNVLASGTLYWDIQDFGQPNETVQEVLLTEIYGPFTSPDSALADYLDDNDMLGVPVHLSDYRGVIYERMADDMIANGEVIICPSAIFHNV